MLLKVELEGGKTAIFSNLTGAVGVMDKELLDLLESFSSPKIPSQVSNNEEVKKNAIAALLKNGFLVEEGSNEIEVFKGKFEETRAPKQYSFMFVMTMDCNFGCVYCYESRIKSRISKETADKCIGHAIQLMKEKSQKVVPLAFYGGEPLMEFDTIKYIIEKFKAEIPGDAKIATRIVTNASLLTPERAAFLKENNCYHIQITVDGLPEIHDRRRPYRDGKGSFGEVVGGLKNALDFLPNVSLRINLDKDNIGEVGRLLEYLESSGLKRPNLHITFGQVHVSADGPRGHATKCIQDYEFGKEFLNLAKLARGMGFSASFSPPRMVFCCAYSKSSVIFNPDGSLTPCWEGVFIDEFTVGSVNSRPVFNKNADLFYKRNPMDFEKCRKCDIVAFCGGGCISAAKAVNGDINSVACPYYRENFKEMVKLYIADCLENEKMHKKVSFVKDTKPG